ncbi:conserved hypothetical protein [Verticillium alfalfae VaMs.102]|uniref:Uncharacterized protein n=1 Tax=Verticillium alfalfae (strain VaMs.102 / ATCC MYA-4576 / FGSC 10136) TaxID=526221 RepID=C9SRF4_VERA1|nr:conserved hypothetical protein [Verticillium alfalfae VaMs.102]EEY21369.1 conserved hypothetical protein [Verticillium alfalfae VaMs.102]
MYSSGARTPGRRLSVPSGANPFQSPHGTPVSRVIFAPNAVNNPNVAPFSPAGSSILGSPPTPSSAWSGRRDSTSSAADEAWRRRTWHPESRGFQPNASSHLSNVVTPGQFQPGPPLPAANVLNPQQTVRLPGIESFDPLLPRPATPPRRNPSPMMIDAEPKGQPTHVGADDRRNWDINHHQYTMSAAMISTPRDSKRHGWYHGPLAQQAQGELVRGPRVDRMEHPNMTAFSGFPGREPPRESPSQPQPHSQQPGGDRTAENSSRFDALVAVAASEGSTATAY